MDPSAIMKTCQLTNQPHNHTMLSRQLPNTTAANLCPLTNTCFDGDSLHNRPLHVFITLSLGSLSTHARRMHALPQIKPHATQTPVSLRFITPQRRAEGVPLLKQSHCACSFTLKSIHREQGGNDG